MGVKNNLVINHLGQPLRFLLDRLHPILTEFLLLLRGLDLRQGGLIGLTDPIFIKVLQIREKVLIRQDIRYDEKKLSRQDSEVHHKKRGARISRTPAATSYAL